MKGLLSNAIKILLVMFTLFAVTSCQLLAPGGTVSSIHEETVVVTTKGNSDDETNTQSTDTVESSSDGVGSEETTLEETEGSTASPTVSLEGLSFSVERVFPGFEVAAPLFLTYAPGMLTADQVYIVSQAGLVHILSVFSDGSDASVFLDISGRVESRGSEQGLLGLAFHPNFPDTPYVFVNYTDGESTVVSKFTSADGLTADASSEEVILSFEQPYSNHNGGHLAFGPDGYLYIASGDGGAAGDPHINGQRLDTLLGKILRIDVDEEPYGIPEDNPFGDQDDARPEIYAYGLRNPWRFSFAPDGKLWVADVGQDRLEEINIVEAGGNYGWSIREAIAPFSERLPDGVSMEDLEPLIEPIWFYEHDMGRSITGGYVYRGIKTFDLEGYYIFGDFVSGRIWALAYNGDVTNGEPDITHTELVDTDLSISSFGEDYSGELYIVDYQGGIYQLLIEE